MSTLELKELSHPSGEVIKIAAGKTLDLNSQGTLVLPTVPHAKMPSGSVLQVLETVSFSSFTTTSTSPVDAGYSVTITPSSTSSKILLICMCNANINGSAGSGLEVVFHRNTTVIGDRNITYSGSAIGSTHIPNYLQHLDSPNTTSAVTYRLYAKSHGGHSERIAADWGGVRITAMEIQG